MPTAFITGATGFLGQHMVDVLLEQGWDVIALVRNVEAAKETYGDRISLAQGDISNIAAIGDAMPQNVDCIFHVAADTSLWKAQHNAQRDTNVTGTANMVHVAVDKDAKRFIHISSIAVYGEHKGLITEKTERRGRDAPTNYARTKAAAERRVKDAAMRGLDVVILNPCHIVGRYDGHNWARLILDVKAATLPGIPPGAGCFANGRNVAEAAVTAVTKGRIGESYILGGPYASFDEYLGEAGKQLNVTVDAKKSPAIALKIFASILAVKGMFSSKKPMITSEEVAMVCEHINASSAKAIAELDYKERSLEQSIADSIAYLKSQDKL